MIFLDFKQLESFVTIAKLKSFSKAADKLFLTQPTISNHIHLLEKELGTILFNRTNKNITLTEAGDILYEYAISILNKKEHAYFSLNEFKGKIEGILEISSSSIPELYFLTEAICKFNLVYPDVRYSLMKYDTKTVYEKILSGDIDFGLVGSLKESNQLEYIKIFQDDVVLVTPTTGPFSGFSAMTAAELVTLPIIMREDGSGTRSSVESFMAKQGIPIEDIKVIAEVENNETIKKLVELGLGVSFISWKSVENELKDGLLKVIPLKDAVIRRHFYFVYHKKRVLSPLADTFKNFVQEVYGPSFAQT